MMIGCGGMAMVQDGRMSIRVHTSPSGNIIVSILRGDDVVLCSYFTMDPDNGSAAVKVFKMVKGNTGDGWLLFGRVEPQVAGEPVIHDKGGAWELRTPEAPLPDDREEQRVIKQLKSRALEILDTE